MLIVSASVYFKYTAQGLDRMLKSKGMNSV